jgi:hypothetical protein
MALIKLNNRGVKDATAFGSISSLGELTFISKQTASSSATISFTSGIDSTYKEYIFYWVNCHPSADGTRLQFNLSTDSGSNYNVTKTTTSFRAYHNEADSDTGLYYETGNDLAQSTGFQDLSDYNGNGNDEASSGYLHLFNPSSTTFVKHFISNANSYQSSDYSMNTFVAGYGNTTSSIDAVRFQMSSGNIDSGDIILFGLN